MKDERASLRPAQAAVEGDQLLERAALLEPGVVEASDHDVGDVGEPVGPQQMLRCVGRQRSQRIVTLDVIVAEVSRALRSEDDGPRSRERTSSQPT